MSPNQALMCFLLLVAASTSALRYERCRAVADSLPASCRLRDDYYCDEVECFGSLLHGTLTLINCEDPPKVEITLDYWSHQFAVTTEQTSCDVEMLPGDRLYATFSRNGSHVQFEAHGIMEQDKATAVIFPAMSIPLDLLHCMCASIGNIGLSFQLPILAGVTYSCSMKTCFEHRCNVSYGDTNLESSAVIDPCSESVTVIITDKATRDRVWRHVFYQNSTVQFTLLNFTPTVYIMITKFNYSMTISVKLKVYSYNTTVFHGERIILDRSHCLNRFPTAPFSDRNGDRCRTDTDDYNYPFPYRYPSYYDNYHKTYPDPPYSGPHSKTCQALQKIASGSAAQCSVVDSCTTLECDFMGLYHAKLTVRTCNRTLKHAVDVIILYARGDTILDETLTNSKIQPIEFAGIHLFDLTTNITHVKHRDSLVLGVSVNTPLGQGTVIIPDTSIPIDHCGCFGISCSSDHSGSGGSKHSKLLLMKILVPAVGVLVLLLVVTAVVVLVVVGVVYAKKKQGRPYTYHVISVKEDVEEMT